MKTTIVVPHRMKGGGHMLAKDVPGFMDIFIPEMNPGVDLETLTARSRTVITVKGIIPYFGDSIRNNQISD